MKGAAMFENDFFGKLFDFNGDDELDSLEKSIALGAFAQLMSDDNDDDVDDDNDDDDDADDADDDF